MGEASLLLTLLHRTDQLAAYVRCDRSCKDVTAVAHGGTICIAVSA